MLARTVPVLLIVTAASLPGCAHRQQREPEPAVLARLEFMAPANLTLRATTYPAGGPYDRAYWTIKARCDAAGQSRGREPLWESTLHPYWDAGPVPEGSEWGSPPPGHYVADVYVNDEKIHLYLPWSDESVTLGKSGGGRPGRTRGRAAFDAAAQDGAEVARLAVDFTPPRKPSSHANFTTGSSLITGVPGNLRRPATTRASGVP